MARYAHILRHEGAWQEAITLLDACVSGFCVALGSEHEDTCAAAAQLADALPRAAASDGDRAVLEQAAARLSRGGAELQSRFEAAAATYRPVLSLGTSKEAGGEASFTF